MPWKGIKSVFTEKNEKKAKKNRLSPCRFKKLTYLCHAFRAKHGFVAQLVEHRTENPCVGGSSPPETTKGVVSRDATSFFILGAPLALICGHFL